MSTSEEPKSETERGPEEGQARRAVGRASGEGREIPLFLRERSDGHKGNAQDEKDEVGE
jgi:hypothetical protein